MNDSRLPFSIQHIHTTDLCKGWSFPLHRHSFSQLYAVLDGIVHYHCDGKLQILKKGDAILVAPGISRELVSVSDSGKALVVLFTDDFNLTTRFSLFHLNSVQQDIALKLSDVEQKKSEPSTITEMRFNYLAVDLFAPDFGKPEKAEDNCRKICLAAERLMQANIENLLKLDDIAKLVGVSRAGLERAFHIYSGVSVMRRYRMIRVNSARKMLLKGVSISETAYLTGFSSPQHFATVFKAETGMTPSEI
jgi:AraC-like DNA-binding protein